ncbi:MAG: hypothetical protein Q9165_003980 [Trypethelium subeluteriae]
MRTQSYGAPKLPRRLLDQLQDDGIAKGSGQRRNGFRPAGRKEKRKAEREQNKVVKRNSRGNHKRSNGSRIASHIDQKEHDPEEDSDESEDSPKAESRSAKPPKPVLRSTKPISESARYESSSDSSADDAQEEEETVLRLSKGVKDQLARDDAEIAALEKKLGLKGRKGGSSKDLESDGLDALIDGVSEGDERNTQSLKRKSAEDEDWLQRKRMKAGDKIRNYVEDSISSLDDGLEAGIPRHGAYETEDLLSEQEASDLSQDTEGTDLDTRDSGSEFEGFDSEVITEVPKRVRENPYVAPVPAGAAPVAKYIPPSLRELPASDGEAMQRVRRQTQGLLNRLSEANLLTILRDVEDLYQSHPRQHVSSTLIDLLLGLISDSTILNDTFLILHAGFISAVYTVIGIDFGGQLLEQAIERLDEQYRAAQSSESVGKESTNLVSLIAQLYNFQVIGSALVYDYIRLFLQDLSELNTELLLRIIRSSGSQLRQDDPSSLKDIIVLLQRSIAVAGEENLSVRTKFMIETITNLKNNRVKTGAAASAVAHEHTARMKKTLGSLKTRSIRAREPLRVGLNDIRNSQKKGKWWLVGASWDNPHTSNSNEPIQSITTPLPNASTQKLPHGDPDTTTTDQEPDLNALATHNRINNPLRRTIFITLLSATDARDACLRLQNLRLKRAQQAEIPRVLLQCCGAEGGYNPYYALVARRICDGDGKSATSRRGRKEGLGRLWGLDDGGGGGGDPDGEGGREGAKRMRFAFAAAVWDVWRGMGEGGDEDDGDGEGKGEGEGDMGMRRIVNLAKMVGSLVVDGVLDITVMKTLNLAYLRTSTRTFVEIMLVTVIQQTQSSASVKDASQSKNKAVLISIFSKARDTQDLAAGLQYFLKRHVARSDIVTSVKERKVVRWSCEVIGELLLAFVVGKGNAAVDVDAFSD